jgi:hypothetical protein
MVVTGSPSSEDGRETQILVWERKGGAVFTCTSPWEHAV